MYLKDKGNIKPSSIAKELNEKAANIRTWKHVDKWDGKLPKPGAPRGNKNAKGNKGGGAPKGNFNNLKHGMYVPQERCTNSNLAKMYPELMANTRKELSKEKPLDKLWNAILDLESRILMMQKITYVKDKNDMTKELKKIVDGDSIIKEYEIQFAWDKENNAVSIISSAMKRLAEMIKQYEEMAHKDWDLISEEQRLKVELLKQKISDNEDDEIEDDGFIDALKSEANDIWD
jgi:uncharacterized protein YjcR